MRSYRDYLDRQGVPGGPWVVTPVDLVEDGRLGSDEPTALAPPSGVKPQERLEQSRSSTGAGELA